MKWTKYTHKLFGKIIISFGPILKEKFGLNLSFFLWLKFLRIEFGKTENTDPNHGSNHPSPRISSKVGFFFILNFHTNLYNFSGLMFGVQNSWGEVYSKYDTKTTDNVWKVELFWFIIPFFVKCSSTYQLQKTFSNKVKEVLPLLILNFLLALRFDQYCSRNGSEVKKIDKFVRPFSILLTCYLHSSKELSQDSIAWLTQR